MSGGYWPGFVSGYVSGLIAIPLYVLGWKTYDWLKKRLGR